MRYPDAGPQSRGLPSIVSADIPDETPATVAPSASPKAPPEMT